MLRCKHNEVMMALKSIYQDIWVYLYQFIVQPSTNCFFLQFTFLACSWWGRDELVWTILVPRFYKPTIVQRPLIKALCPMNFLLFMKTVLREALGTDSWEYNFEVSFQCTLSIQRKFAKVTPSCHLASLVCIKLFSVWWITILLMSMPKINCIISPLGLVKCILCKIVNSHQQNN